MPFPITCSSCGKTFAIADDVYERKVKGRIVTIKCKQCQAGIRIDDTHSGAPLVGAEPSVAHAAAAPAPAPAAESKPDSAPKADAPKAEAKPEPPKAQPAAASAAAPKAQPAAAPKAQSVAAGLRAQPPAAASAPKPQSPVAPRSPTLLGIAAPKAEHFAAAAALKAQPIASAPRAQPVAAGAPRAQPLASAPRAQSTTTATAPRAQPAAVTPKAPTAATATPLAVPAGSPKAEPAKIAELAALAEPQTADPAPVTEVLWAVDYPDGQDRELTAQQVKNELASGAINETTLVWREGMDEWKELGQVPELLAPVPKPVPAPKPAAPEPAVPRAKAPSTPMLDLAAQRAPAPPPPPSPLEPFGQRPRAPSSAELREPAAQRPRWPSFAAIPELHAQRPPAPPPAPIPKTPPPFSPFDAPQPTTPTFPAGSVPITGLTPPAFPAAPFPAPIPRSAAPFAPATPPQPLAPPPWQPSAAVPQRAAVEEWPAKSRAPLIIGVIVAIAVIAAVIFFLTRASAEAPTLPGQISALPASTPTTGHPSAEPAATVDTSPAPTATSAGEGPSSRGAIDPPASGPTATPNAGFAELFASGARRADEKQGASGPNQRFDATAAKAALTAVTPATAACREKGGPAGKATVVVTFEPSGKVSSATVSDAPFAGTSSGACIATAMKRATVPAFNGLPGMVTKTISIQ
jgi:hypothetical protein